MAVRHRQESIIPPSLEDFERKNDHMFVSLFGRLDGAFTHTLIAMKDERHVNEEINK